jgi:UDP-N-acetylglucosamine--N-acetylmuramyl-(pentapeptide) pyrophosphoryl-undecaprenol N-acetylglucosamine transferase
MKTKTEVKYLISGGGTGGHIYPAVAIAQALEEKENAEVLFVGAKGKMEMEKIPSLGYSIVGLPIRGFQRGKIMANLLLPFRLLISLCKSFFLIKKHKPKAVVGTGGYASAPLVMMASVMKIPVFLQEQNSFPGLVNRKMVRFAKKIFVAYDGLEKFFPKSKIDITGNPIRTNIVKELTKKQEISKSTQRILILGGSLGAKALNDFVSSNIEQIKSSDTEWVWQCGKGYTQQCEDILAKHGNPNQIQLKPFIQDMAKEYALADVVLCRSGALTVSEIALAGCATVFVPSPNVTDNHQYHNAKSIAEKEGCILLPEKELSGFYDSLISLVNDEKRKESLKANLAQFSKPTASVDIAQIIIDNGK